MGMLRRNLGCGSIGAAKNDRHFKSIARHVIHFDRIGNDLVAADKRKIKAHELHNRTQTRHRCSDRKSSETQFGNWGIDHSHRTPFIQHAFGHLISTIIFSDLFAQDKYGGVPCHLLIEGLTDGFSHFYSLHWLNSLIHGAKTSSPSVMGSGQGLSSANLIAAITLSF